jgi:uncharacterized damage-inducible protein DinB
VIDPDYCALMADYNLWMNQRLYALCSELPDQERKRDRGAFFRSIHGTLNHLLYGDRVWLGRFLGVPLTDRRMGEELYADFGQLGHERGLTDRRIVEWARSLAPEWLAQPFTYTSNLDGKTRTLPAWVLVVHLFNHQTHHRGQVTALLSQLGRDYGTTDLPWLPGL